MKEKKKEPPVRTEQFSVQLSLFGETTKQDADSKSIRLWESLANAVFEGNRNANRIEGCFLHSKIEHIEFEGEEIEIVKHPARIEKRNKKTGEREFIDFFPQRKEYMVLETLIKLAVDDRERAFYIDTSENTSLGIRVNLYAVGKAMKKHAGKQRLSYAQIKEAIKVLAGAITAFKSNSANREVTASLISSFYYQDNSDPRKATFLINFHPMISELVKRVAFRQINFGRVLRLPDVFTSFLYKKFAHKFTQASRGNSYHFLLSTILKEVPSVRRWKRIERKIQRVSDSLESLQKEDVVERYEIEKSRELCRGGKRTIDCKFIVFFTATFIDEQVRANAVINRNILYEDNGEAFVRPEYKDYINRFSNVSRARREYTSDLERWESLKRVRSNENIVENVFKNAKRIDG